MRSSVLAALLAASASAATFTNNLGNTDPSFVFTTNPNDTAWDISVPYDRFNPPRKPWDVAVQNGSVSISGWVTLPQSYVNNYPDAGGGVGVASFQASLQIPGVSTFKISDVEQISYQLSANVGNTAPTIMTFWLLMNNGHMYLLHGANSTFSTSRSGPENTGDYIYTYTNITQTDLYQDPRYTPFPADAEFVGLVFRSDASSSGPPTFTQLRDQFLDVTFQSASITLSGAPIPEPSTYGLILGGLALAGAAIRRRRK